MASDTPTIPLSIRVAAETAQKFQTMVAQRGLKAGSLLESLIASHEREQIAVPEDLKAPFKKLEVVMGEIKGSWVQKTQEKEAIIENQINLQEENSKLLAERKLLKEKLEIGFKETERFVSRGAAFTSPPSQNRTWSFPPSGSQHVSFSIAVSL